MNKLIDWLKEKISSKYLVIYKTKEGKIKSYVIKKPNLYNSFGNKNELRSNVGFRSYCYARKSTRSFRHDRIISITKL